jgi:hypothetical protein
MDKKGISVMIGYVLLIVAVIVMGSLVYTWLKSYVPAEAIDCPDGTSVFINNWECSPHVNGGWQLNVTLRNNGRFNIGGYFLRSTDTADQELATTDISGKLTNFSGVRLGNAVKFVPGSDNPLEPGDEATNVFDLENKIYLIEVLPLRFQTEENKNTLVSCAGAKIREVINCAEE